MSTKPVRIDQAIFAAVADLCQYDLAFLTKSARGRLNQTGKRLRTWQATIVDVEEFGEWWEAHDWRGRKGQPPNTGQVLEYWGQFGEWRKNGKKPPKIAQPVTRQIRRKLDAEEIPDEVRLAQRKALKEHKEWLCRKDAGEDVGPAPGSLGDDE